MIADLLLGLLLMAAGISGVVLNRRVAAVGRRARTEALGAAQVDAWRLERRARRAAELRAWDRDFAALLPPPPPCTSSEHNHIDDMRFGSGEVRRICVIWPSYLNGGAVLEPGEYVMSAADAAQRIREVFGPRS